MTIMVINGQVSTMRHNVTCEWRSSCRTSAVLAGRLESIAELVCVTLIRGVVCLAIGGLVILVRFGFPRLSRVGFLVVVFLVVELVDLMRASVKSFALTRELKVTKKLKETTAHIHISTRILRLKVVNDIVHGRRKRHEKVVYFCFIVLLVLKEMAKG